MLEPSYLFKVHYLTASKRSHENNSNSISAKIKFVDGARAEVYQNEKKINCNDQSAVAI